MEYECNEKPIKCSICGIMNKISDALEHNNMCLNRTEKCYICNEFILMSCFEQHQMICESQKS